MIYDKEFTTNPQPDKGNLAKTWTSLGNAKESLAKQEITPSKLSSEDSDAAPIGNNKGKIEINDLVYYSGKWVAVFDLKDVSTVVLKMGDKLTEASSSECSKEIIVNILFCTKDTPSFHIISVNGRNKLEIIGKKLCKITGVKSEKFSWYFAGKEIPQTDTIESILIKPGEKLSCFVLGHNIKTFKRFPRLDDSRGWYMSHGSPDAISFITQKGIKLFGFGTYYTREGPNTYTMQYELHIDDSKIKEETLPITKPDESAQVAQVFFHENKEPIAVNVGANITIIIKYPEYDEASKLIVGTGGDEYSSIEENEADIFKVEESGHSGNGTDVSAGQVPELYYSTDN